jgi:uncharacterized protein with von Willebrand factor type A (vWA) domain
MSRFTDALAKASEALRRRPKASATDAVQTDRFDQVIFDETLAAAPRMAELVESLPLAEGHAHDLVRDVFLQFWQSAPALRQREDMHPSRLLNQAVVSTVVNSPECDRLKRISVHDRYAAAMATVAVGEQIRNIVGAQQQNAQEGQQAAQDAQDEAEAAGAALEALMGAVGDQGEGEGEDSGDVSAQIEAAIAALEAAQSGADDALADAQDDIDRAQRAAQAATNRGMHEALEKLEAEASTFSSWGMGPDEVEKMDFETRAALALSLRSSRISRFFDLLGRFRAMAEAMRARKVEYVRSEVTGVELSDRLPDVLPGELALRVNRHTRLEFLARLTGHRLATYEFHGEENVGRGPVIMVVDCSQSMEAADVARIPREVWAKGFALTMLEQASKTRRDMVVILFSGSNQQRVYEFPAGRASIAEKLAVVQDFFRGSTNYEQPLDLAINYIREHFDDARQPKADIITITDDTMGIDQGWLKMTYEPAKEALGFRHFGIAVGVQVGSALRDMCDNVRSVHEFADPASVSDIFQLVP